ncbi:MAG: SDR family NAD(P)-dependent oxidoreductase [Candidatus Heimdallarchaeota archaeon]
MNTTQNLKEKVIVITGGTSGLGKEAAKELAKTNATLVILARNMELASQVKEEIIEYSDNDKIEFIQSDLASLKSIKEAAERIVSKYPKIDVLINNAGLFNSKRVLTEDGYESTFGVDYLAHFYLVLLLIEQEHHQE